MAEASPITLFPRMSETMHYHKGRKAYRDRLNHSHATEAALLRGDKPPELRVEDGDDEMGDTFSVAGDTVNHYHYSGPSPGPPPIPPPVAKAESGGAVKKWLKRAAIASLLPAGIGGTLATDALLNREPPAVERTATDTPVATPAPDETVEIVTGRWDP